jgi:hypothetical protein
MLFNFSAEGWVVLLGPSPGALPQDFEMLGSVNYRLSTPASPKRLEFTASRGVEIFPTGTTSLDIIEYDNDSFTTVNPQLAHQTRWVREQTHRYFLTLAAGQSETSQHRGGAFAMWTTLDGRETKVETLGVQIIKGAEGKLAPVFGPIPPELSELIILEAESDKKSVNDQSAIIRIEITPAEFERTHKVFERWEKDAKAGRLQGDDPYVNGIEFLKRTVDRLDQCSHKLKLEQSNPKEPGQVVRKDLRQQPIDYIRMIRKGNDTWHVPNSSFPWSWRPTVQLPGQ